MNLFLVLKVCVCAVFFIATAGIVSAHKLNPEFIEKITGETIAENHSASSTDPRFEERTYASFPEWYIVYNAQEYTDFIARGGRPSQFPYFASIEQYWESVRYVRDALGNASIDSNTDTVLRVIGASFTFENTIIGVYEKTVGARFEPLNFSGTTVEDEYTEAVAKEYGEFLLHTPWYAFPYGHTLVGLWTTYGWSSFSPRGIERRIVFTIGYTLKGMYATIIGKLSSASLGNAELNTTVTVDSISEATLMQITGVTIIEKNVEHIHVEAPRYRAFTEVAKKIAERGGNFVTIEGHQKIMLTVLVSPNATCLTPMPIQFAMPILTQPSISRIAITAPVTDLAQILRDLRACDILVEHVYDY